MTAKIKRSAHGRIRDYSYKPHGVTNRDFARVYWPYLPLVAVISLLLAFGGQAGSLQAAVRHPNHRVLAYATSMSVSGLLSSTNNARSSNGVAPLSLNGQLNAAAQAKANDMAARNYWSHNTPEGNPPWVFVTAQGYSYQKLGENLATGFADEQSTINGWMASPPHRENLLDPAFLEVGFGYANNPNYTAAGGGPMTIMVAFYGKPAGAASPAPPSSSPPPVAATKPSSPPPSSPIPAAPSEAAPSPQLASPPPAANPANNQDVAKPKNAEPVTTDTSTKGATLSFRTSRAQVAFAKLPMASYATGLATFVIFASAGLWLTRHAFAFRRALIAGESFVISHPLIDIGFVTIASLSFLLTQTAGFIQ